MGERLRPLGSSWMSPYALAAQLTAQAGRDTGAAYANVGESLGNGILRADAQNRADDIREREYTREDIRFNEANRRFDVQRQDRLAEEKFNHAKDSIALLAHLKSGYEAEAASLANLDQNDPAVARKLAELMGKSRDAESSMAAQLQTIGILHASSLPKPPLLPEQEAVDSYLATHQMSGPGQAAVAPPAPTDAAMPPAGPMSDEQMEEGLAAELGRAEERLFQLHHNAPKGILATAKNYRQALDVEANIKVLKTKLSELGRKRAESRDAEKNARENAQALDKESASQDERDARELAHLNEGFVGEGLGESETLGEARARRKYYDAQMGIDVAQTKAENRSEISEARRIRTEQRALANAKELASFREGLRANRSLTPSQRFSETIKHLNARIGAANAVLADKSGASDEQRTEATQDLMDASKAMRELTNEDWKDDPEYKAATPEQQRIIDEKIRARRTER